MLQQFAATHNVKAVTVLIGANNFGFADIVQTCVDDFLLSPSWWPNYCNDDSNVKAYFTASSVATQTTNIKGAILNVRQAMLNAGYADSAVQDHRADLLVADPERFRLPLLAVGLHAAVDRWLRVLEQRRRLGQQHRRADDRQLGEERRGADRARATRASSTTRTRSSGAGCARTRSACSRRRASRTGRAPARPTRPSGSARSARRRRSSGRTSCRKTRTRTTGVSSRCATACARRTTAARARGGTCTIASTGLNGFGEPQMALN